MDLRFESLELTVIYPPQFLSVFRLLIVLIFILSLPWIAHPQAPQGKDINTRDSIADDKHNFNSPEEELRFKAAVRREISTHRELLDRAEEIGRISGEIRASFERNKILGVVELKKLDRLDKLARKIRSSAGGSNDDLKQVPQEIEPAVIRLSELSAIIAKDVKNSSRMVVSAGMIENSNEMIEIIQHLRTLVHP